MRQFQVRYRGFRITPFIRCKPIHIGTTKLYCLGPIALFIRAGGEAHAS